jgi:RNA polymerase sigma-70 factor (ECF subfamily)
MTTRLDTQDAAMAGAPLRTDAAMSQELARAYDEHLEFVWRSLRRLGVPHDVLEDACQDVFVVAARRIAEFEGRARLRTWLFAIAQRVAQRKRRDRFRERRRIDALAIASGHSGNARDDHAQRDAAATLARLLDGLDDAQRLIYVLVELEELSAVEVAASIGVNLNTVYGRLRAARAKLRQLAGTSESPGGGAA